MTVVRRVPGAWWAVVVLLLGACVSCGGDGPAVAVQESASSSVTQSVRPTSVVDTQSVSQVRTDPDGQGLLAEYTAGCEVSASLRVDEDLQQVWIGVDIVRPLTADDDGVVICPGVVEFGTVHARLRAPLGPRVLVSSSDTLQPYDGALLRDPAALPAGYVVSRESGVGTAVFVQSETGRTATWSRWFAAPPSLTADGACAPSRGSVEISQGPVGAEVGMGDPGVRRQSTHAGTTLTIWMNSGGKGGLVSFVDDAGTVAVLNQPACQGDELLTEDEMTAVAESLVR